MSTRNRSTRLASRPASSASNSGPSTAPTTRKGRSAGRAAQREPAATAPTARKARARGPTADDSEEAARLPSERGKVKQKQRRAPSPAVEPSSGNGMSDLEEEKDEDEAENEDQNQDQGHDGKQAAAETQETIHLAAGQADDSSDARPDEYQDAQEVADVDAARPRRQRHRTSSMSGTTARESNVQPQMQSDDSVLSEKANLRAERVESLATLWNKAWKCVNSIVPGRLKSDDQLLGLFNEFRSRKGAAYEQLKHIRSELHSTFNIYRSNQTFINVQMAVSEIATAPGVEMRYNEIPDDRRTDEALQLANVAIWLLDATDDPEPELWEWDDEFALPYAHNLGDGIGETLLNDATVDLAISLRTQVFIQFLGSPENYDSGNRTRTLLSQVFWGLEPEVDVPVGERISLKGWKTPGLSKVTGRFKAKLVEIVDEIDALVDQYPQDEQRETLHSELLQRFPVDNFYLQLLRWARQRAQELRRSVDDRLDGDVEALRQTLVSSIGNTDSRRETRVGESTNARAVESEIPTALVENSRAKAGHAGATNGQDMGFQKPPTVAKRGKKSLPRDLTKRLNARRKSLMAKNPAGTATSATSKPATNSANSAQEAHDDDNLELGNDESEAQNQRADDGPAINNDDGAEPAVIPATQRIAEGFGRNRVPKSSLTKPRAFIDPQPGASRVYWNENGDSQRSTAGGSRPTSTRTPERSKEHQAQQARRSSRDSDEESAFQEDTRQLPAPSRRATASSARPTAERKRARDGSYSDDDDERAESPAKRQRRDTPQSHFQPSSRPSPNRSSHQASIRAEYPANSSRRVAGRNQWTDEEDNLLLKGLEHYANQYAVMSKILHEDWDRLQILKGNGRKNADLTNRARVLKKREIETNGGVARGLRQRPGLFKVPLKTAEIGNLRAKGIDLSGLFEVPSD